MQLAAAEIPSKTTFYRGGRESNCQPASALETPAVTWLFAKKVQANAYMEQCRRGTDDTAACRVWCYKFPDGYRFLLIDNTHAGALYSAFEELGDDMFRAWQHWSSMNSREAPLQVNTTNPEVWRAGLIRGVLELGYHGWHTSGLKRSGGGWFHDEYALVAETPQSMPVAPALAPAAAACIVTAIPKNKVKGDKTAEILAGVAFCVLAVGLVGWGIHTITKKRRGRTQASPFQFPSESA